MNKEEREGKKETGSGESMSSASFDDDDDDYVSLGYSF